jgi:hypothetical protein
MKVNPGIRLTVGVKWNDAALVRNTMFVRRSAARTAEENPGL